MSRMSNSEGLESSEQGSTSLVDKRPDEKFVTMRSDQAWHLLDETKSHDPRHQTVLALALRDAAAIIIRASELNGVITFPESIRTALIEINLEEIQTENKNIISLEQNQTVVSYPATGLPLSA